MVVNAAIYGYRTRRTYFDSTKTISYPFIWNDPSTLSPELVLRFRYYHFAITILQLKLHDPIHNHIQMFTVSLLSYNVILSDTLSM